MVSTNSSNRPNRLSTLRPAKPIWISPIDWYPNAEDGESAVVYVSPPASKVRRLGCKSRKKLTKLCQYSRYWILQVATHSLPHSSRDIITVYSVTDLVDLASRSVPYNRKLVECMTCNGRSHPSHQIYGQNSIIHM